MNLFKIDNHIDIQTITNDNNYNLKKIIRINNHNNIYFNFV